MACLRKTLSVAEKTTHKVFFVLLVDIQSLLDQFKRMELISSRIDDMSDMESVYPHTLATVANDLGDSVSHFLDHYVSLLSFDSVARAAAVFQVKFFLGEEGQGSMAGS